VTRRRSSLVLHVCPVARYWAGRRGGLIPDQTPAPFTLIRLIDQVLDLLDAEPRFRHFTLDGETRLIDDYLRLRPEQFERVERLAAAGRLLLGPWYAAPQPALSNVESLIRNLLIGLRTARALGGKPLLVGYLPDVSALHSALPQILKSFGIQGIIFAAPSAPDTPLESVYRGLDGTRSLVGDPREALITADSTLMALRQALAPLSDSGHVLLLSRWAVNTTEADAAAWLRGLNETQSARGDDVFVSHPGVYAGALEVNALNSELPALDLHVDLTAEGRMIRDWNVAISRDLLRWVEPFCAWAELAPLARLAHALRRPQTAIQALWRAVLADQADADLHDPHDPTAAEQRTSRKQSHRVAAVQLRDAALTALAENVNTAALPANVTPALASRPLVIFNSGSARYVGLFRYAVDLAAAFPDVDRAALDLATHTLIVHRDGECVGASAPDRQVGDALTALIKVDLPAFGYATYRLSLAPLPAQLPTLIPTPAPGSELVGCLTGVHEGTLPLTAGLIAASDWRFEITTVKLPEEAERGGLIVRGSNRGDDPLWVTITPLRPFRFCETVTMDEAPTGGKLAVEPTTGVFKFKANGHRLLTFWLHD
jgi:hypothetical protein